MGHFIGGILVTLLYALVVMLGLELVHEDVEVVPALGYFASIGAVLLTHVVGQLLRPLTK